MDNCSLSRPSQSTEKEYIEFQLKLIRFETRLRLDQVHFEVLRTLRAVYWHLEFLESDNYSIVSHSMHMNPLASLGRSSQFEAMKLMLSAFGIMCCAMSFDIVHRISRCFSQFFFFGFVFVILLLQFA